mmetsp:Transcript_6879/g.20969  ORF Transcript_6879/g.20969 Transcript_6879/m.20969 type:complete len:294 (+) Transcript_6879:1087-1968(+)
MRLDDVGPLSRVAARLDRVGVYRALTQQPLCAGAREQPSTLRALDLEECLPDGAALRLGLDEALERLEEALRGVDVLQAPAQARFLEGLLDQPRLVLAHHPRVHVEPGDAVRGQRFGAERVGHGRVDAARDEDEDRLGRHHPAQPRDLGIREILAVPRAPQPGEVHEPPERRESGHAVLDLGMPLQSKDWFIAVRHARVWRVLGEAKGLEPRRQRHHAVAVRHPHPRSVRLRGQERSRRGDSKRGFAELAHPALLHLPAEVVAQQLTPVANTENGDLQVPHFRVDAARRGIEH